MTWHFKLTRRVRLFLETILVLVMLMVGVVGWGLWHLSQGPVDLKPFLPTLARTFNSWLPGITFSIQDASLEWGGAQKPFVMHVQNVDLKSPRGRTIGQVDEIALGLAPQALFLGQIAPTSIDIINPTVTVTRYPDGRIAFRFDRDEPNDEKDTGLNIQETLNALKTESYAFTAFLKRVMVSNFTMRYRDFITQQNMVGENGKILIERGDDDYLEGQALLYMPVGDELKMVTMDIHPDRTHSRSLATARLPTITATQLAEWLPDTAELKNIAGEFNGEMAIAISNTLQPDFVEFSVGTENTTITMPGAFPEPVIIKTGQIGMRYDLNDKILSLQNTRIVLPHTTLSLEAKLDNPFQVNPPENAKMVLQGEASLKNLPLDELYRYWPIPLADSARSWVTKHIKDGKANKANALFTLSLPANAFQTKKFEPVELNDLHGEIKFKNLTTDYLPPMLPVKKIDGIARYTDHDFNIETTSGTLRDTKVTEGIIRISPLSAHEDSFINIDLKLEGPLQDPLVLLSQKPVEFTQEVGIDPKQVSGNAKTDLHLDFPLLDDLELEQLNVKTTSRLDNVTVNHAYRNAALRGSDLDLTVNNDGLALKGKATLSDAPLDSLVWNEYFGDTAKLKREFILKGAATPQLLKDLNLDVAQYFGNRASVNSTITEAQNGDTAITLNADLTQARIMVPEMSAEKKIGEPGKLTFNLNAPAKGLITMKDLSLTSNAVNFDNATVTFNNDDSLEKIIIPQFKAGRSTIAINATALPRNKGWQASIKGNVLDASGFWSAEDASSKDDKNTQPPIKLDLNIGTLYLDPVYPLKNVRGKFFIDNDVILQADLDAKAGDSLMVMRFAPDAKGDRVLKFESNNAGEAVKALGITDSMRGGTISINGGSAAGTPQQIRGNLLLENFSLVKAPILARLLNAFSLGGLLDLLNQKGLVFSRMQSEFIHQDKQIILKKGKMAGASLGLNFSGTINQKTDKLDMNGTIVPVQGINKLASNIPLIGQILTGIKGEGLVAATYTIKGPTKDPSVMVNPLSVLTPGILRSIFFENNKE